MDLTRYGIQGDFPRLTKLTAEIVGLEARYREQQQRHAQLQRELQQARESDLNAEARAVQTGGKRPKPKAPELERSLLAAEHDAEVLRRALTMAQQDHAQFIAQHKGEIREAILESLHSRARELREHSLACLELFGALEDSRKDLRAVREEPEPEPEMPADWRGNRVSSSFIGFGPNAAPPPGPSRGEVEQTLAFLAGLVAQFEQREREGAA